jgi:hypothetical protein
MDLWSPVEVEKEKVYYWQIAQLKLWISKAADEIYVAHEQASDVSVEQKVVIAAERKKPEKIEWNRFIVEERSSIIQLNPAVPDRAVVVGSEAPVKILPETKAMFFVGIPIWVRLYIGENKKKEVSEIPTVILSNTWFGDPTGGVLCYGIKSRALRTMDELEESPGKAVCTVVVHNKSEVQLDFQKFCIHVENLKLYRGTKRLWTNEVSIDFFGEDQPSQIVLSQKKPEIEKDCTLICEERVPASTSLLQKSAGLFKYFTDF